MKIRSIFTLLILTLLVSYSRAQDIAIKTNLLYGGYTYTPNLSLEIGLGKRSTLDLGGGYNPWNLDGTAENNKKLVHWLGEIEYRYWLCQRFSDTFSECTFSVANIILRNRICHSYSVKVLKNTASKAMATEGEFHTATTSF